MPPNPSRATIVATILAAGKGTRMRSRLVKVLHPFLGRPMVLHLVDAAFRAGVDRVVSVVGHQAAEVESAVAGAFRGWNLGFAHQTEQRGTGHAVASALSELGDAGTVLVIYGDTPLLRSQTLAQLLTAHRKEGHAMTVATFRAADPTGYGRIVRDASGDRILRIVEHADATPEERQINEVNAGICAIRRDLLEPALARLEPHNKQGELYLTDVVELLATSGEHVAAYTIADPVEASGINTRAQLATLEEIALQRMRLTWMDRGVSMQDPGSIRIDAEVDIGEDTLLGPNVQLLGKTRIGHGCRIDAGALLDGCELGDFVHIKAYSVAAGSRLATGAEIGPFAHLRPGTELGEKAKVGNFVETKMAKIAAHAKASHLSYLGDCEIGRDVNIGAGTITCNYDGVDKHKTIIEDEVFIGSDTQLVAPVRVGRRATIGAGTTVTRDVPEGSLVVTRSEARTILGYYDRHRLPRLEKKRAQRAAAKAERAASIAAATPETNADKEGT
ncbi:MAG: bifunctional UDP-N-acetylglucosamine diphosphorylase/glucosamine-1-phosphate N-acetyltransferase GlmU [Deltaproteobacteria bacterium]|nr:bifunctional UDP-N-acetylglucosamine diphosphorylase/glucosamine-1-phosphate N-acetyltransferase GlmU [Deltaproteobacteria bacterium]